MIYVSSMESFWAIALTCAAMIFTVVFTIDVCVNLNDSCSDNKTMSTIFNITTVICITAMVISAGGYIYERTL